MEHFGGDSCPHHAPLGRWCRGLCIGKLGVIGASVIRSSLYSRYASDPTESLTILGIRTALTSLPRAGVSSSLLLYIKESIKHVKTDIPYSTLLLYTPPKRHVLVSIHYYITFHNSQLSSHPPYISSFTHPIPRLLHVVSSPRPLHLPNQIHILQQWLQWTMEKLLSRPTAFATVLQVARPIADSSMSNRLAVRTSSQLMPKPSRVRAKMLVATAGMDP